MTKLKPCPFCGNTAHISTYSKNKPIYAILCNQCTASTAWYKSKILVINAWNRRASD